LIASVQTSAEKTKEGMQERASRRWDSKREGRRGGQRNREVGTREGMQIRGETGVTEKGVKRGEEQ